MWQSNFSILPLRSTRSRVGSRSWPRRLDHRRASGTARGRLPWIDSSMLTTSPLTVICSAPVNVGRNWLRKTIKPLSCVPASSSGLYTADAVEHTVRCEQIPTPGVQNHPRHRGMRAGRPRGFPSHAWSSAVVSGSLTGRSRSAPLTFVLSTGVAARRRCGAIARARLAPRQGGDVFQQ